MESDVIKLLSSFLDAVPMQVKEWDKKVIDYLTKDKSTQQEFRKGTDTKRWEIYSSIKYRGRYLAV